MEINGSRLFPGIGILLLLLLCFTPLAAQETENYSIQVDENGKPYFIQSLYWQEVADILYYEVVIEKQSDDSSLLIPVYEETERLKTETNSIQVSLRPGRYRYRIDVYNLLNRKETETDWAYFTIIQALQPKINGVTPETTYLEEENDGVYTVTGENLLAESVYELRIPEKNGGIVGTVAEIDEKNRRAKVHFNINAIDIGDYTLTVTNPGGLSDSGARPVTVKFRKMRDFDVAAGYTLPIVVRDDTIAQYFNSRVWPASAAARLTYIHFKRKFGYFGLGADAAYAFMSAQFGTYSIQGNLLNAHLNLVYQYPVIKNRLMLDVRAGAGVTLFLDYRFTFSNGITSVPLNSAALSVDLSVSAQWYVLKRMYLEFGLSYVMAFNPDMAFDVFAPTLSIGWQF